LHNKLLVEGRGKREEGRGKREEGRGKREETEKNIGTSLLCGQKSLVESSDIATNNN
jgi:hypothetical protein